MASLILTPGDPTGIGPEIAVKALSRLGEFPNTQLIVVGSRKALAKEAAALRLPLPENDFVRYQDIDGDAPGTIAYRALDVAVRMIAHGEARALVTGPISKRNLAAAGHDFPGHTEILENLANKYFERPIQETEAHGEDTPSPAKTKDLIASNDAIKSKFSLPHRQGGRNTALHRAEMLFVHKGFRLLLLTRHIPLAEVPAALMKSGAVAGPVKTLIAFLRHQLNIEEPHLVMLGVNPHAGEIGGEEEAKVFAPVIKAVNGIGASRITGPVAADGFFRGFDPANPGCDAVIAAYHDQGLVPFKLVAGYAAVNMTIGLPFLRTSVSHGTAEDIAGLGLAKEDSLIAALHAARESL
ncbi:MAG TPA: 4-hydroxythreonine-4-phosphate dehydrogenase PdxA [Alphaproteobacteria bacterium]|nr:4-hydroxythreonine-4-phosphate dehydrogenase PdxA [Alphaproteobacteria bacterium]